MYLIAEPSLRKRVEFKWNEWLVRRAHADDFVPIKISWKFVVFGTFKTLWRNLPFIKCVIIFKEKPLLCALFKN